MQKTRRTALALGLAWFAALAAQAAENGEPSATASVGSFTVTASGPAVPRQVRVLAPGDLRITNHTSSTIDPTRPGIESLLCVAEAGGAATRVTVSSLNAVVGRTWSLNAPSGTPIGYRLYLTDASNQVLLMAGTDDAVSRSVGLASGTVTTDPEACGPGNLKAHVSLSRPIPDNDSGTAYNDTVTIVFAPD